MPQGLRLTELLPGGLPTCFLENNRAGVRIALNELDEFSPEVLMPLAEHHQIQALVVKEPSPGYLEIAVNFTRNGQQVDPTEQAYRRAQLLGGIDLIFNAFRLEEPDLARAKLSMPNGVTLRDILPKEISVDGTINDKPELAEGALTTNLRVRTAIKHGSAEQIAITEIAGTFDIAASLVTSAEGEYWHFHFEHAPEDRHIRQRTFALFVRDCLSDLKLR